MMSRDDLAGSICYPSIKTVASDCSNLYQMVNTGAVLISLVVLVWASVLSFWPGLIIGFPFSQSLLLVVGLILSVFLSKKKPDRVWFAARSLSETVKTLSWRYVMRAAPLDGGGAEACYWDKIKKACEESNDLIRKNKFVIESLDIEMLNIQRSLAIDKKIKLYAEGRVRSQFDWYLNKSKNNKRYSSRLYYLLIIINFLAVVFSVSEESGFIGVKLPTDVLITLAGAVIAWAQCKKFNELAAAYEFTASEIAPLMIEVEKITTDSQLSEFVSTAEELFSREHTQWAAKRS